MLFPRQLAVLLGGRQAQGSGVARLVAVSFLKAMSGQLWPAVCVPVTGVKGTVLSPLPALQTPSLAIFPEFFVGTPGPSMPEPSVSPLHGE